MSSGSMCGPSNPLQNLQKHTSKDRTLQQDRHRTSSQRPATGALFRSNQHHQSPAFDQEFQQFSSLGLPQQQQPGFAPSHSPILHHAQTSFIPQQTAPSGDWASDFQRMTLRSASPSLSQSSKGKQKVVQRQPSVQNWHQDFLQSSRQGSASPVLQHQPLYAGHGYTSSPMYGAQGGAQLSVTGGPVISQENQYTEADFERMFDEASTQLDALAAAEQAQAQEQAHQVDVSQKEAEEAAFRRANEDFLRNQPVQEFPVREVPLDQPLLQQQEEPQQEQDLTNQEHDDLARTAGQLLDSLSHNQSQKFQQSSFLALMRKLRDHEVKVEGGKMVENDDPMLPSADLMSSGPFALAGEQVPGRISAGQWEEAF